MIVESPVITSQRCAFVGRVENDRTHTHTEVEIFVPVGAVRGADVPDRTLILCPEQFFSETIGIVCARKAAVADQQGIFSIVL